MSKYIDIYNTIKDEMFDIALDEIYGMSEEEAIHYLMNDAIPVTGAVSELIYYSQTEPIAREYHCEIVEMMKDVYGDCIPYGCIKSGNDMTWFAWEYLVLGNESNIDEIIELAKEKGIIESEEEEEDDDLRI